MEIIDGKMCDCFQNNQEIYVHCIDVDEFVEARIENLKAVKFRLAFAHFSYPLELQVRRLSLFLATDDMDELCSLQSPVILDITSSCIYMVINSSVFGG